MDAAALSAEELRDAFLGALSGVGKRVKSLRFLVFFLGGGMVFFNGVLRFYNVFFWGFMLSFGRRSMSTDGSNPRKSQSAKSK